MFLGTLRRSLGCFFPLLSRRLSDNKERGSSSPMDRSIYHLYRDYYDTVDRAVCRTGREARALISSLKP